VKTVEKEASQPYNYRPANETVETSEMVKYETKTHNTPQIEEKETKKTKRSQETTPLALPPFFLTIKQSKFPTAEAPLTRSVHRLSRTP